MKAVLGLLIGFNVMFAVMAAREIKTIREQRVTDRMALCQIYWNTVKGIEEREDFFHKCNHATGY